MDSTISVSPVTKFVAGSYRILFKLSQSNQRQIPVSIRDPFSVYVINRTFFKDGEDRCLYDVFCL